MRILVGNDFSEDVRSDRKWSGWWVQRLVWFAQDHDLIILPTEPDVDFFKYVCDLIEIDFSSLRFLNTGKEDGQGDEMISFASLNEPLFIQEVREIIASAEVTEIIALWPDLSVAKFCEKLGLSAKYAGQGFARQDGGRLMNSKSVFRAIAEGVGAPVPTGGVCSNPTVFKDELRSILDLGRDVIVKQDYLSGGRGNEIITPNEPFQPIGARRVVKVETNEELDAYVENRWSEVSSDGRNRAVVEEYFRDSRAFFAEYLITDEAVGLAGTGEMLSAPYAVGQIMPIQNLDAVSVQAIVDGGKRLADAVAAMGYRGHLSADAIVTPDRKVFFSEFNGRVTGSTHVYSGLGGRLLGSAYGKDRIILERVWPSGWKTESFMDAYRRVRDSGLLYDKTSKSGVVLQHAFDRQYMAVMYCVVQRTLDEAWKTDRQLKAVFSLS